MPHRRILSLWFPRLAAERVERRGGVHLGAPLAVVATRQNAQVLISLNAAAEEEGLSPGQAVSDATALCPNLRTVYDNPLEEERFLNALSRWAGKFSPWVSARMPGSLLLDMSGCAHLFGGEAGVVALIEQDCAGLKLTVRIGIADTVGGAWALARYAGQRAVGGRSGDDIDQEAYATRSRAFKRRNWERGGAAPMIQADSVAPSIAPPGEIAMALADLPLAALRIDSASCTKLARLGIRRIADLADLPRGAVARRFGADVLLRLDQALGFAPEPVCPADPPRNFATRMSFPDPIGLPADIEAGIHRLLPPLCEKLRLAGRGMRACRLTLMRADGTAQMVEAGLARPAHDPDRIAPLLILHVPDIEPGYGIDVMRLEAHVSEPVTPHQHKGHFEANQSARARRDQNTDHADLLGRLGARIGLEGLAVLHPADSHIPEMTEVEHAAAYAEPAAGWPAPPGDRPLLMFRPEPVLVEGAARPPKRFVWRRQALEVMAAQGPERIAPEWWRDLPDWRTGTRDYWQITTDAGRRLWLFQALGGAVNGGWFCHGDFG